jgi:hypothetical protein
VQSGVRDEEKRNSLGLQRCEMKDAIVRLEAWHSLGGSLEGYICFLCRATSATYLSLSAALTQHFFVQALDLRHGWHVDSKLEESGGR